MSIIIEKQRTNVFKVTISEDVTTRHTVTVTDDVHRDLTENRVTKESLLKFSFKFLLDREPNTAILSFFEVTKISSYFSNYTDEVRRWCKIIN